MVQWLRICLPVQGRWGQSLLWEGPTCLGAAEPPRQNYWAWALEPTGRSYRSRVPGACVRSQRSHCSEKPGHHKEEHPPLATTGDGPCVAAKTLRHQKQISFKALTCFKHAFLNLTVNTATLGLGLVYEIHLRFLDKMELWKVFCGGGGIS